MVGNYWEPVGVRDLLSLTESTVGVSNFVETPYVAANVCPNSAKLLVTGVSNGFGLLPGNAIAVGANVGGSAGVQSAGTHYIGDGDPNTNGLTGYIGDTYRNVQGGAGTTFYVKESGDGTGSGWVGK